MSNEELLAEYLDLTKKVEDTFNDERAKIQRRMDELYFSLGINAHVFGKIVRASLAPINADDVVSTDNMSV